jgi:hypothetical protein
MPSQYERTRTAESLFPLRWIGRGDIPLPARSADLNLVSQPDHHYHYHHHTVPLLLCKIKISSIYYVRELQSHFIKSRSCNRRVTCRPMSFTTFTRTSFPTLRESLSAVHTPAGDDRPRGTRQSSRTCNLQETTSTDRSARIGESPR